MGVKEHQVRVVTVGEGERGASLVSRSGRSATVGREEISGQAKKGARWMPWHGPAKKDAVSCEKLGGGARIL
jgi:hypothetical protein